MSARRDPRYKTARWQRCAKEAIARAGGLCEMRLDDRCTRIATHGNHIRSPLTATTPTENDRLFWSPANHEAACTHCNTSDGARLGNRMRKLDTYTPSRNW